MHKDKKTAQQLKTGRIAKNLEKIRRRAEEFRGELISSGIINGSVTSSSTERTDTETKKDEFVG